MQYILMITINLIFGADNIYSSNTISTQESSMNNLNKDKNDYTVDYVKKSTFNSNEIIPEEKLTTSINISPRSCNRSPLFKKVEYNLSSVVESEEDDIIEDKRKTVSATICQSSQKVNFNNIDYNNIDNLINGNPLDQTKINIDNPILRDNEILANIKLQVNQLDIKDQNYFKTITNPKLEYMFKYQAFLHNKILNSSKTNKSELENLKIKLDKKICKLNRYSHRNLILDLQKQFLQEDIITAKLLSAEVNFKEKTYEKSLQILAKFTDKKNFFFALVNKLTQLRRDIFALTLEQTFQKDEFQKVNLEKNIINLSVNKNIISDKIYKNISKIYYNSSLDDKLQQELQLILTNINTQQHIILTLKTKLKKLNNDIEGFKKRLQSDLNDNYSKYKKQEQKCELLQNTINTKIKNNDEFIEFLKQEKTQCYADIRKEKN